MIDFMPIRGEASDIIRIVIGKRGTVGLTSELKLRFDFGRLRPRWSRESEGAAVAISGPHSARLVTDVALSCSNDGDCAAEFAIAAGEQKAFVLTYFVSHGESTGRG